MTDQPGQRPEERLPVLREPSELAPSTEVVPSTERFTAHPSAHKSGLSPEREPQIARFAHLARLLVLPRIGFRHERADVEHE